MRNLILTPYRYYRVTFKKKKRRMASVLDLSELLQQDTIGQCRSPVVYRNIIKAFPHQYQFDSTLWAQSTNVYKLDPVKRWKAVI
jgi:hypothetical protein